MGSISNLYCSRTDEEENILSNYRVYVSFCGKDPTTTTTSSSTNVCNWIECYNPSENSWHRVTSVPGLKENQVLKGFSMVSLGNMIYLIGGRLYHKDIINSSSSGSHYDGHDEDDFPDFDVHDIELDVTPTVLRYDVVGDSWSKCAPMKTARCDFACTVSNDKIFVAGGQSTVGSAKGISSAEVYDPALDEWKSLPNMSTIRYKCVGVTWLGKIYVVGGFAERRGGGGGDNYGSPGPYIMERSSAEVYDYEQNKWLFVARMWDLDVPPNQIVAVDGKLLSSGDCLNAWKGHVEAYDGKLNMWVMLRGSGFDNLSSPICTETNWPPVQRLYLTMAPIGKNLYFLAGYKVPGENSRTKTEVHVFDTCANGGRWRSFEPIDEDGEKEICCHGCVLKHEP